MTIQTTEQRLTGTLEELGPSASSRSGGGSSCSSEKFEYLEDRTRRGDRPPRDRGSQLPRHAGPGDPYVLAVALRGERGSQRPGHHSDQGPARKWRSPSGVTEDRNIISRAGLSTGTCVAVALRGDGGSQHVHQSACQPEAATREFLCYVGALRPSFALQGERHRSRSARMPSAASLRSPAAPKGGRYAGWPAQTAYLCFQTKWSERRHRFMSRTFSFGATHASHVYWRFRSTAFGVDSDRVTTVGAVSRPALLSARLVGSAV